MGAILSTEGQQQQQWQQQQQQQQQGQQQQQRRRHNIIWLQKCLQSYKSVFDGV